MFGIVTAAKQITERAVDLWWFAAHSDGPLEVGQRLIQVAVCRTQAPCLAAAVKQVGTLGLTFNEAAQQGQRFAGLAALELVFQHLRLKAEQRAAVLGLADIARLVAGGQFAQLLTTLRGTRVAGEQGVAKARVASMHRRQFQPQVVPDLGRLVRVVASLAHQGQADLIGLTLLVAGEAESAGQRRHLTHQADQAEHAQEHAEGRARLHVPQALQRVALHVVADLMADDGGQLSLVVHAQQQAGPDLHHAVGRHAGVEERGAHRIDAHVGAVAAGQLAGHVLQVFLQGRIAHQEGAAAQPRLLAVHHGPQAALVGGHVGALEARRSQPAALRAARGRSEQAGQGQALSTADQRTALHCGLGKPVSSTSMDSAASLASRRSPLPRASRLNQSTLPLFRSTRDA
mmetsp:Transcript_7059/g.30062  ORF Transcript_7059/g.30062 Transcript_7059/m.30062 type:complete len:402 (-) Transcript_7059:940-2145(-)